MAALAVLAPEKTVLSPTPPPPGPPKSDAYIPTAKDQEILDTPEHLYHVLTWTDLTDIISRNALEELTRRPSDLRRYLDWGQSIRKEYGSVLKYILTQRLHWEGNLEAKSSIPFDNEDDTSILFNDWPYGLADGIVHIVIWTKAEIPVDSTTGDLTPESRQLIVEYVNRVFVKDLGLSADKVLWFKNWAALQSVRTVEHIHVMVDTAGVEGGMDRLRTVAR